MIFLDTKPKGVPFTNIRFSCGRAFSADCGNFPNDSPQAPIPFQNPVPLISATQSCHIHPIAKHQIVDLDVFPWSLDPETSPVESIVLENRSIFFAKRWGEKSPTGPFYLGKHPRIGHGSIREK